MGNTLKEIFSDSKGTLSSFRIMAMIGLVAGSAALILQSTEYACTTANIDLSLAALFGGIFAGKAHQKKSEEGRT